MKVLLQLVVVLIITFVVGTSAFGCPRNSDGLYDRQIILGKFASILNNSIRSYVPRPPGFYVQDEKPGGFFVYDLTDTSNKNLASATCINFIDKHVYHFTSSFLEASQSHIAILDNGKIKVFESINCANSEERLNSVVTYLGNMLKNDRNLSELITRVKNYRRYGIYITTDASGVICEDEDEKVTKNSDALYKRKNVLKEMSSVLYSAITKDFNEYNFLFSVENERAIGFFVYDLTDPSNKQSSLTERVDFVNNHVYHFSWIDAPFSFSNIAVLEDGKLKFFKNINCSGKGDRLKDVIGYLNRKFEPNQNRKEILRRVKNYRKFGVYASYNGLSKPQCKEAMKIEK